MNFFRGVCVLALVCAFVSCDAPRINPLDPESPDYKYSTIEGTVKTKSSQQPMVGVKVSWKNLYQNISVQTGTDGTYRIDRLERSSGVIYFEKEGYSKDSTQIQLSGKKSIVPDRQLNAIPRLVLYNLYTSVENLYPSIQTDTLIVKASVFDEEGDIDSVAIQNKSINFYKYLPYDSNTKLYQNVFQSSDLKIPSLIETQGTNFEIIAVDKEKRKFVLGSSSLTRVITQEVKCISPANNTSLSAGTPIIFIWEKFEPRFDFSYSIQIYTNKLGEDLIPIREKKLISSFDTQLSWSVQLQPGNYYWVVLAIDNFGNRAKSKPATFSIQ